MFLTVYLTPSLIEWIIIFFLGGGLESEAQWRSCYYLDEFLYKTIWEYQSRLFENNILPRPNTEHWHHTKHCDNTILAGVIQVLMKMFTKQLDRDSTTTADKGTFWKARYSHFTLGLINRISFKTYVYSQLNTLIWWPTWVIAQLVIFSFYLVI